jgi:hypothetical protein
MRVSLPGVITKKSPTEAEEKKMHPCKTINRRMFCRKYILVLLFQNIHKIIVLITQAPANKPPD